MIFDTHDFVIFIVGCSLLGVHVALLLRQGVGACSKQRSRLHLRVVRESMAALQKKVGAYFCQSQDDPIKPEVDRLVTARRFKMACVMYSVGTWCFILIEVAVILNIVLGTPRFLTNGLDGLVHAAFLLLTIAKVEPRVLSVSTLDAWYSLFMLIMAATTLPLVIYKEALPLLSNSTNALRLLVGMTSMNMPLIMFWNTAYVITGVLSYHFSNYVLQEDCSVIFTHTVGSGECLSAINTVCVLFAFKMAMEVQARQQIEAKSARRETSAVIALLSTMGDAVVELDKDLRIMGTCSQLATMLFQGGGRSLSGMPFAQLLASDEDQQLFQEYMTKVAPSDQTLADVFHVKIRDTMNNRVQVEVFHVLKTGDGPEEHAHLLGIKEEPEFEREDGVKAAAMADLEFPAPEAPMSVTMDASPQVKVTMRATTFEVFQYSTDFLALCGQRPTQDNFVQWIAESSRNDFVTHFEAKVERWRATNNTVMRISYRNMRLKIPLSGNNTFRLSTTCTMVLGTQTDHGDDSGEVQPMAEAVFTDIAAHCMGSRKLRRHRNSGGDNDNASNNASNSGSLSEHSVRTGRSTPRSEERKSENPRQTIGSL
mmetsp:Transcript_44137/g.137456  ORF Transcript_44137/g.137456 Transcript_44137/m.137456 type:complete len:596 (-) Transcript_44137:142-1929(-)